MAEQELNSRARLAILSEKLGKEVTFLRDGVGADMEAACADPEAGSVNLLRMCASTSKRKAKASMRKATISNSAFRESLAKLATSCDVMSNQRHLHCNGKPGWNVGE